jgi:hypothetical protein
MEKNPEPYKCELCNYVTFVKKNLVWHNSLDSHLYKVRNSKPTAISIFNEIKHLSTEERDKLLNYITNYNFKNKLAL